MYNIKAQISTSWRFFVQRRRHKGRLSVDSRDTAPRAEDNVTKETAQNVKAYSQRIQPNMQV